MFNITGDKKGEDGHFYYFVAFQWIDSGKRVYFLFYFLFLSRWINLHESDF